MKIDIKSRIFRPWSLRLLPLFLILPALVIAIRLSGNRNLNLYVTWLLIANNLLLLLFLMLRLREKLLWATGRNSLLLAPAVKGMALSVPMVPGEVSRLAVGQGYLFTGDGLYGEKRSPFGRWSSVAAHIGIVIVLSVATLDNLVQFSGQVLAGENLSLPLNRMETYLSYSKGPLTRFRDIRYHLKGGERILPDERYPKGAMAYKLVPQAGGKPVWQGVAPLRETIHAAGYELHPLDFLYDIWLVITVGKNHVLFSQFLRFSPLQKPDGDFTHHVRIDSEYDKLKGEGWFNGRNSHLRLRLTHDGNPISVDLGLAPDHEQASGRYFVRNNGIGRWTLTNIMRHRHRLGMALGGVIFVAALIPSILVRRRFVSIVAETENCRIVTNDAGFAALLNDHGAQMEECR